MAESRGNTYHVLRHGEAEQNVLGIVYGKNDDAYPLTPLGRAQVQSAVEKLSGITKIYASPICRARESAELAADALGVDRATIEYDKRLRELNFGIFQGKSISEFIAYRDEHVHSLADAFPEGESYLDAKRRFGAWLYETDAKLFHEKVLVVTHGIGVESLIAVAQGLTNAETLKYVRNHKFSYAHLAEFAFLRHVVNEDFEVIDQ
jgi:broad specificity phosphatase PhoE